MVAVGDRPRAWVGVDGRLGDWFDHGAIPVDEYEWAEIMADNGLIEVSPVAGDREWEIEQIALLYGNELHIYWHEGFDGLLRGDRTVTLEEGRIAAVEWDRLHEDMDVSEDVDDFGNSLTYAHHEACGMEYELDNETGVLRSWHDGVGLVTETTLGSPSDWYEIVNEHNEGACI